MLDEFDDFGTKKNEKENSTKTADITINNNQNMNDNDKKTLKENDFNEENYSLKELNDKIKYLQDVIKNNSNNENRIIELMNKIEQKDNEIKELRAILPFEIKKGEKIMCIIIISLDQKINCPFICKNTDIFNKLENSLYDKYPEYKEVENYFVVNGNRINKYKNLEENKIKDNEIITLITVDY